ncbi:SCP2 sterol-binding domain-containing protein [Actinokineospora iranica]|uniref:SCP-2 sterol transfer family protein n=1 Tax=Actinokineospora iranica TaxID=1271860 RepID=A0A1G6Q1E0_9PSEU|nr:SCP2 sterol-binding domain-containing protein [Actinokineospora iranica]SDC86173.1 SCP-2 sterol transfer family protein [Actinokineospora iranica]
MRIARRRRKWHRLPPVAVVDLDGFAEAIDPAKLDPAQFVQLVETLDMLGDAGTGIDLAGMRTETFLRFLARATRAQLDALTTHPHLRHVVFTEVFRRMSDHLAPDRAAGLRAVLHWRFTGGAGEDGYDRFETVIANGRCTSGDEPTDDPRVTITIAPVDFLRAVIGAVSLPMLFLSSKVKVKGDIAFAATLIDYFDLPRP